MTKTYEYKNEVNCGNCKHHKRDFDTGEWICLNLDSIYYTEETDYRDVCGDFEDKKTRRL